MAALRNTLKLLLTTAAITATATFLTVLLLNGSKYQQPVAHRRLHAASYLQSAAAASHCAGTLYPSLCVSTLLSVPNLTAKPLPVVISAAVNHTAVAVLQSSRNCSSILRQRHTYLDRTQQMALSDCLELLDATLDDLRLAAGRLRCPSSRRWSSDLSTVLSAAITNQFTCLDGFAFVPGEDSIRPEIQQRFLHISQLVSNALSMSKKIPTPATGSSVEEAFEGYGEVRAGFPAWLRRRDRRLLLTPSPAGFPPDLVVAKDGSGNFTTVGEAVAAAPNNSATRFVIYIKAGGYFENVEVGKNKINLMFVGDGMWKTVIKASRNVVDGWTTFRSATVAVVGQGFVARDLTIENAAGPSKHQAVALRVGADLTAFYRCSFAAYQDTLYAHSLRQFYRECDIYGTVDFIFGDASAVFQNCSLYARKPDPNQQNIFTAQGREDPNQNTGISIQRCKVEAAADLIPVASQFQTYLGRPWKKFSRTVFIESYLGSLIDPTGWMEWNGTFALDTLYYGEYMNHGPGANTTGRVKWPGYRVINSSVEAMNFTVGSFIQGDQWLGSYGVPFTAGLTA
ncbi:Pectinesterase 3 [Apostasia shenzhenica]|uniref:Pectinesterase n=1 Tax=Apostasia shenzhenica TaxID=1088818 RepID=A0A2I0B366_9ASPA|nr:Pectinesterase 3 [Apostasia shenzhenica]